MISALLAFALASLLIELTPGPNMAYLAILASDRGRLPGLAAVAGVALGLGVLGLLATLGLGTFVLDNRAAYEILRWAGIAYLVYLAWEAYSDSQKPVEILNANETAWRSFRRGLFTNLLNPKAALFYVAVMPSFLTSTAIGEAVLFGAVYVAVATLVHAGVVLLAGALQPVLTVPRRRRQMGVVFAILLLGVAAWVALTTGHPASR